MATIGAIEELASCSSSVAGEASVRDRGVDGCKIVDEAAAEVLRPSLIGRSSDGCVGLRKRCLLVTDSHLQGEY